jgi:hypothetical protein
MEAYYLLFWVNGKPDFKIVKAHSNEDAIKKADIDPKIVYYVSTLDAWERFNERRRGFYS